MSAGAAAAYNFDDTPPPNAAPVRRWVAMGDSFTAGHEPGMARWADALAERLRATEPELDHLNLAEARAPIAQVAEEQLEPAIAHQPDLVTLVAGANDVLLSVRPDLDAVAAMLGGMLVRLRGALPEVRLVTATYPDLTRFSPLRDRARRRVGQGMDELNRIIRVAAERHGAACVSLGGNVEETIRSYFAQDGLHPSAAGHARAAIAFADALVELGVPVDPSGGHP